MATLMGRAAAIVNLGTRCLPVVSNYVCSRKLKWRTFFLTTTSLLMRYNDVIKVKVSSQPRYRYCVLSTSEDIGAFNTAPMTKEVIPFRWGFLDEILPEESVLLFVSRL